MELVSNPFQALNDVFIKPRRVFATLAQKNNWSWIPFFLIMAMLIIPTLAYFNFVDFSWYRDAMIHLQYGNKSPAEQDIVRQHMSLPQVKFITLVSVSIGVIVLNALIALYLNLMTKMDDENVNGFMDWYGMMWWVNMPIVIGSILSLLMLALADNHQILPSDIAPTTLAFILGLKMDSSWYNLAANIRLESFWSIYLMAVGICQWTKLSNKQAWLIASGPYALIWGVWLAIKLI